MHGHADVVRVLCDHESARVRHLLQQTPNGVSPLTLAERRGKPSLIVPLLRCYHRNLRRRYLAGKLGDAGDNVSDQHLTTLCLKYREHLFRESDWEQAGDSPSQAWGISQAARLARIKMSEPTADETVSESLDFGKKQRHDRVLSQATWNGMDANVQRRSLRAQMDLPACDAPAASRRSASARRSSAPAPEAISASRRPWGSSAPRDRPSSCSGIRSSGIVARGPSAHLLQAARPESGAYSDASSPSSSPPGLVLPRVSSGGRGLFSGRHREVEALAADDAMEELMADFLSDREVEAPSRSERDKPRGKLFGDVGIYSESESESLEGDPT